MKSTEEKIRQIYHYYGYITYILSKAAFGYPNPCYGTFMTRQKVLEAWEKTAEMMRDGKAPRKLCIYIHIPFCHSGCLYCMSGSIRVRRGGDFLGRYLRTIYDEMKYLSPALRDVEITSVYLGGGTPSILTAPQIESLMGNLKKYYNVGSESRITFEASPFTLDEEKISLLKALGVYELDLGIQSFDQEVLKKNRRPQEVRQSIDILRFARKAGIPSIAIDVMVGMPYQSGASALATMETAVSLGVDGVMVNEFLPLEITRFCAEGNRYTPEDHRKKKEAMAAVDRLLREAGYRCTPNGYRKHWTPEDEQKKYKNQETESLLAFGYFSYSHAYAALMYQLLCPFENFVSRIGVKNHLMKDSKSIFRFFLAARLDRRYLEFSRDRGRDAGYFTYVGFKLDLSTEMHNFAYTNYDTIDLEKFRERFGKDFMDAFRTQLAILRGLGLARISGRELEFLGDDLVTRKVIRTFFVDKVYIERALGAAEEPYDPPMDYAPLILGLSREM